MRPWYEPRSVARDLDRDVSCVWTARPEGEHRLVPDGCVDVVWLDTGRAWLCGTETTAWTFRLPAGVEAAGIRFRPGVAAAVFGFDGTEVANRRVPLDAVLAGPAARRLDDRLGDAVGAPVGRAAVLEAEARAWLSRATRAVDPVAAAAASAAPNGAPAPIDALAHELGLSSRQLHRRCLRSFGYGAATLLRILRLQRFLALADQPRSLARLAAAAGYSDQAHLTRECRALAGLTPGELRRTPGLTTASDPFKTARPPTGTMGS